MQIYALKAGGFFHISHQATVACTTTLSKIGFLFRPQHSYAKTSTDRRASLNDEKVKSDSCYVLQITRSRCFRQCQWPVLQPPL